MAQDAATGQFTVVVDGDRNTGVWPADRVVPAGWRTVAGPASREVCLREVEGAAAGQAPATDSGASLTAMFAESVARYGDRMAVSDAETSLTYARLDALSTRLAEDLRNGGVAAGDRVALLLPRGAGVFVAVLAVLKAGAAYVAIDSRVPAARRELMIADSGARVLLTDAAGKSAAGDTAEVQLVDLADLAARADGDPRPAGGGATSIAGPGGACVMFTSGSSGRPKAVLLDHRSIVHFARNPSLPPLSAEDRVGHVSSLSFDAFSFETWAGFAAGAEVVVLPAVPDLIRADVQRALRRHRITVLLMPTMAVHTIVREDQDAFAGLRLLLTGGDVLRPAVCEELFAGAFTGELVNLYGPTEAATACTVHPVGREDAAAEAVPIGVAFAGTPVYLLDEHLDPVPDGEAGQIYVGGPGVARCYLGRPALTAEVFRPDPFAPGGGRMYATGDLARRRPDGALLFAGRVDDQVKIRGYRVEPQEVEHVLCGHPRVREAAVLAVGEGDAVRLVALVVPYGDLPGRELREYASGLLPDYLVPSALVFLTEIPGNGRGKRDVAELRRIAEEQLRRSREQIAPRDDVERYLAGLWEELLMAEHVSVTDDFFALGGNSLLAFRLQRRISRDLGVPIEPLDVLTTSRLDGLADLIRDRRDAPAHAQLPTP